MTLPASVHNAFGRFRILNTGLGVAAEICAFVGAAASVSSAGSCRPDLSGPKSGLK